MKHIQTVRKQMMFKTVANKPQILLSTDSFVTSQSMIKQSKTNSRSNRIPTKENTWSY